MSPKNKKKVSWLYSVYWVIPQGLNLCADVSEHTVYSIFIGGAYPAYEDGTECRHIKFRGRGITQKKEYNSLCLWFRASLIYINKCPTRCNTKQSIYYSASSLYMFRVSNTPIITSTQNCNYSLRYCAATSLQRGQDWPRWREVAAQKIWPVQEAVVTVLCIPDDACVWHPKHVEWTCRIINRLFCVASRWTIINKEYNIRSTPKVWN